MNLILQDSGIKSYVYDQQVYMYRIFYSSLTIVPYVCIISFILIYLDQNKLLINLFIPFSAIYN